jgi:DNA modification methylase
MTESLLNGAVTLHCGDCREILKTLPDNSLDSAVMDPPYALVSIVKRFGKVSADDDTRTSERTRNRSDGYARAASGFMGQQWDTGETAFDPDTWREVWRVLKPGGYLLAFAGTRTYHRLAVAIEDAGFEIRDMIAWAYGSGFPKSHDAAKGIDAKLGVKGTLGEPKSAAHAGWIERGAMRGDEGHDGYQRPWMDDAEAVDRNARQYIPGSDEARKWQGWGSALKPALEPICMARKPIEGTIAENLMKWGAGAINIDGCRVETDESTARQSGINTGVYGSDNRANVRGGSAGRFPANLIHDGSDEVLAVFPESSVTGDRSERSRAATVGETAWLPGNHASQEHTDSGSAARFFYTAKADADDRLGSKHPTVKPLDLMQYLVRLVTPPGGTVLDAFAGTGTTGEAAWREGFKAVLIERGEEYQGDIRERMRLALTGPGTRKRSKNRKKPAPIGGMFGDE